jgi:CHAD domain-containing protein
MRLLGAFARELSGVASPDDPERLHKARVASRRVLVALDMFGADAGTSYVPSLASSVRFVTRKLGKVRDLDVQAAWLEDFSRHCEGKERAGALRMLLRLSGKREKLRPGAVRAASVFVSRTTYAGAMREMRGAKVDMETSGEDVSCNSAAAARYMIVQTDCVVQLAKFLSLPYAHGEHHRLRMETKRLRYAMELAGEGLDEYIAMAKNIQDALGELHDAQVWIEAIPRMKERERKRTEKYFGTSRPWKRLEPGYDAVARDRTNFRDVRYGQISELWNGLSGGMLPRLRERLLEVCRKTDA